MSIFRVGVGKKASATRGLGCPSITGKAAAGPGGGIVQRTAEHIVPETEAESGTLMHSK